MKIQKIFPLIKTNASHILLWSIAVLYLLSSPSLSYHFLVQEGKPLSLDNLPSQETGGIRYNIESVKFWSENMQVHYEMETYALWGWAFLDIGKPVLLKDFDRYFLISNQEKMYVFSTQVFPRPGVQDVFKDLGQEDLSSAGIYAVISRNAIPVGRYSVGLLFEHKYDSEKYFVTIDKELVRTPNHLKLEKAASK